MDSLVLLTYYLSFFCLLEIRWPYCSQGNSETLHPLPFHPSPFTFHPPHPLTLSPCRWLCCSQGYSREDQITEHEDDSLLCNIERIWEHKLLHYLVRHIVASWVEIASGKEVGVHFFLAVILTLGFLFCFRYAFGYLETCEGVLKGQVWI